MVISSDGSERQFQSVIVFEKKKKDKKHYISSSHIPHGVPSKFTSAAFVLRLKKKKKRICKIFWLLEV